MRPYFLAPGATAPPGALVVDAAIENTDAVELSHWRGASCPPALRRDLSTEIVLAAIDSAPELLTAHEWALNTHVDADGLLAQCLACRPELKVHAELLVDAAAYGDFNHLRSGAGAHLALILHQQIRNFHAQGDGWEQACMDHIHQHIDALIAEAAEHDPERDRQVRRIRALRNRLEYRSRGNEQLSVVSQDLAVFQAPYHYGHHADGPSTVSQDDDCPPWALTSLIPATAFLLIALHDDDGVFFQLDAPYHSWAETVELPTVAWPDGAALAAALQERERGDTRWLARPAAADFGFVAQVLSTDLDGRQRAASSLRVTTVTATVQNVLDQR